MRMKDEEWADVLDVNLTGAFYMARAALRPMLKQRSGPDHQHRLASRASWATPARPTTRPRKAGIIGLTKTAAREVASRGITVNAVAPGYIRTEMTDGLPEDAQEAIQELVPLGRFGTADDIAAAAAFLASDDAGYVTGQVLSVDGGLAMM